MADEVTLLLAQATVKGQVKLEHRPPPRVELFAGDTLRVRMAYRVHDESKPEELWTFRLATRVDDGDDSVSERVHRDRKLLSDSIISNVGVDLDFAEPGEYELSYELMARLAHRNWDAKGSFETISEETSDGTVKVTVLDG